MKYTSVSNNFYYLFSYKMLLSLSVFSKTPGFIINILVNVFFWILYHGPSFSYMIQGQVSGITYSFGDNKNWRDEGGTEPGIEKLTLYLY